MEATMKKETTGKTAPKERIIVLEKSEKAVDDFVRAVCCSVSIFPIRFW